MKITNVLYEIDANGFIVDAHGILPVDYENTDKYVSVEPTNTFFKARWNGEKWIESKSQEEIDDLVNNQPTPQPSELEVLKQRTEDLELMLAEIISGGM